MRKILFGNGEHYHVYNRGVDKRRIFTDQYDFQRFFQSMEEFNSVLPIGSIYENSFRKKDGENTGPHQLGNRVSKLVTFVAYGVNPNHYHFLLRQEAEGGISEFMHRLGGGYTKYFNERHERTGALFSGAYKAKHIDKDNYLNYVSAYINLNFKVHQLDTEALQFSKSSWEEYVGNVKKELCDKDVVLKQFTNQKDYEKFALGDLPTMLKNKKHQKDSFDQ